MSLKLLVVGFGPFPGVRHNPSGVVAARVAASPRWQRIDVTAHALVLRTAYAALAEEFEAALAGEPAAVLLIGVAARSKRVRVETRARNRASVLAPDTSGFIRPHAMLDPAGPHVRPSDSAAPVLAALRRSGVPARASHDAGRYLCNASYYRALASPRPTVFVHVPMPPSPHRHRAGSGKHGMRATESWARAIERAALRLLVRARAQGVGTSCVSRSTESR